MLLERGEFAQAVAVPGSSLGNKSPEELKTSLQDELAPRESQHRITQAGTTETKYMGEAPFGFVSISYMLQPDAFLERPGRSHSNNQRRGA